jgi:alcohol dehydrogenase class IV
MGLRRPLRAGFRRRGLSLDGVRSYGEGLTTNRTPQDLDASEADLADEAARQWTAAFNPRPVSKNDFTKLYQMAFEPRSAAHKS